MAVPPRSVTPTPRLIELIDARRRELGLTQDQAGVSGETYANLMRGRRVTLVSLTKIEKALRWPSGAGLGVLHGDPDPVPSDTPRVHLRPDRLEVYGAIDDLPDHTFDRLRAYVDGLTEREPLSGKTPDARRTS